MLGILAWYVECFCFNNHVLSLQNWYFSLKRLGGVTEEVLLATFDARSLEQCLLLGFACLDGRPLLLAHGLLGVGQDSDGGLKDSNLAQSDPGYNKLMWAKPLYIEALLKLGHPVLYSDLDTVWLKRAAALMAGVMESHGADVVMMEDLATGWCEKMFS